MKGVTDILVIGLASLYCKGTKQNPMAVIKEWEKLAQGLEHDVELDQRISQDDVDMVYGAYPSRDVLNGNRPTGKSSSDKAKISRLLLKHSRDELIDIINKYIDDCATSHVYIKNFSTFLNNLPDYTSEVPKVDSYWQ